MGAAKFQHRFQHRFFCQIALRVGSFLKAQRERSNRETVYKVIIGENITVD